MVPVLMAAMATACGREPQETPARAELPVEQAAPVAQEPEQPPEAPIPQDASKGPSGIDTAMWFGDTLQSGVKRLMYSARHSDEMAINMQCRTPGLVTATIVRNTGGAPTAQDAWPFTLMSGDEIVDLEGKVVRTDSDVLFVEAELPVASPVLATMARTGNASLRDGERTVEMNAVSDGERRAIGDFVKACGG